MQLSKDEAIKILSRYDNEYYTPATRQAHRMGAEALRCQQNAVAKDTNVLTNADRIRAMTDDELGKFLMMAHDGAIEIQFCQDRDECFADIDAITNAKCMACMMTWLHQPAGDDV